MIKPERRIKCRVDQLPGVAEVGAFGLNLWRGGGALSPYERLSEDKRREWDASELLVERISERGLLYVIGNFTKTPTDAGVVVFRRRKRLWPGACQVASRIDLHQLLLDNPTEGYCYIFADEALPAETLKASVEYPQEGKTFLGHSFGLAPEIYCCIEEAWDRDHLKCVCYRNMLCELLSIVEGVLKAYDLRYEFVGPDDEIA